MSVLFSVGLSLSPACSCTIQSWCVPTSNHYHLPDADVLCRFLVLYIYRDMGLMILIFSYISPAPVFSGMTARLLLQQPRPPICTRNQQTPAIIPFLSPWLNCICYIVSYITVLNPSFSPFPNITRFLPLFLFSSRTMHFCGICVYPCNFSLLVFFDPPPPLVLAPCHASAIYGLPELIVTFVLFISFFSLVLACSYHIISCCNSTVQVPHSYFS